MNSKFLSNKIIRFGRLVPAALAVCQQARTLRPAKPTLIHARRFPEHVGRQSFPLALRRPRAAGLRPSPAGSLSSALQGRESARSCEINVILIVQQPFAEIVTVNSWRVSDFSWQPGVCARGWQDRLQRPAVKYPASLNFISGLIFPEPPTCILMIITHKAQTDLGVQRRIIPHFMAVTELLASVCAHTHTLTHTQKKAADQKTLKRKEIELFESKSCS